MTKYHSDDTLFQMFSRKTTIEQYDGILRQSGFSMLFDTETIDTDIPVASTDIINVFSDVIIDSGSIEKCLMIYMRKACKKSK